MSKNFTISSLKHDASTIALVTTTNVYEYDSIESGLCAHASTQSLLFGIVASTDGNVVFEELDNIMFGDFWPTINSFVVDDDLISCIANFLLPSVDVIRIYNESAANNGSKRFHLLLRMLFDYIVGRQDDIALNNSWDIVTTSNLMIAFSVIFPTTSFWPVYDIPPGFGKTFAIVETCKDKSVMISTPTAIAAALIPDARTYHHNFVIIQDRIRKNKKVSMFDIFVFDEFSMCEEPHILQIMEYLETSKKHYITLFYGDSCQMLHYKQSQPLDFYSIRASILTKKRAISIVKFSASPIESYFPRYDIISNGVMIQSPYKKFVIKLREHIKKVDCKTNKNTINFELTTEAIDDWLCDSFYKMNVQYDKTITLEDTIQKTREAQQNNTIVANKYHAHLCDNILYCAREKYDVHRLETIIAYTNETSQYIRDKVYDSIDKDSCKFLISQNKLLTEENFSLCFISAKDHRNHSCVINKYVSALPAVIFGSSNILTCGLALKNKKNNIYSINGRQYVLFSVVIESNTTTWEIVRFKQTGFGASGENVATLVDDVSKTSIVFHLYNIDTQLVETHAAIIDKLCSKCGIVNCEYHTRHDYQIPIIHFYYQSAYSYTLFQIQGATINDNIVLITNKVYFTKLLRTMYVVLSRVTGPEKLTVDVSFIQKSLKILYSGTAHTDVNFLSKLLRLDKKYSKLCVTN